MTHLPATRALWVTFGALAVGTTLSMSAAKAWAQTPTVSLGAGIHVIRAELAANNDTRMRGLMFRKSLEPNQGMLFVFDETTRHCMWMKNTLIPLSVAFIAADGEIANIADMKPHDETTHCSIRPVPYALEMDRGWFATRGLKAGTRITGLDKLAPPR
ncbi:MAG: DUF192 domain-containing protein [Betaproteobacteria bacterium]|nr:DUF192 domain-containing protein [Betaproteobacteria bacterium]